VNPKIISIILGIVLLSSVASFSPIPVEGEPQISIVDEHHYLVDSGTLGEQYSITLPESEHVEFSIKIIYEYTYDMEAFDPIGMVSMSDEIVEIEYFGPLDELRENGFDWIPTHGETYTIQFTLFDENEISNEIFRTFNVGSYYANGCPEGYHYIWSDGYCYEVSESSQSNSGGYGNGCPTGYPYEWSDGYCYEVSESSQSNSGGYGNGCPTGYPYEWSDGYCYDQKESSYLSNGCPTGYPYIWSDGSCYNLSENAYYQGNYCPAGYPYVWDDGYCYNQKESNYLSNGCPVGYPYIWSDGYCWDMPQ